MFIRHAPLLPSLQQAIEVGSCNGLPAVNDLPQRSRAHCRHGCATPLDGFEAPLASRPDTDQIWTAGSISVSFWARSPYRNSALSAPTSKS